MKNIIKYGRYKEWQLWKNENILGLALRDKILQNPMVVIPSTDIHSNLLFSFWDIEKLKEGRKNIQFIDENGYSHKLYIKVQFKGRASPLYRLFWNKKFKDYLTFIDQVKYKEEIKVANQKGYENPLFYLTIRKDEDEHFYISKKITSTKYWYIEPIKKNSKKDILKRYQIFLKNLPDLTDKETISQRRVEQSLLRNYLIQNEEEVECGICKKTYPVIFIWCSHIKKRSECTLEEKLDIKNIVMPMCKFGCDDLYEKKYIYINDGFVKFNESIETNIAIRKKISELINNVVSSKYYNKTSKKYFDFNNEVLRNE